LRAIFPLPTLSRPWCGLLQRELSAEVDWGYVSNASGGFLGAWWCFKDWADHEGKRHKVYLQIERGPLCFKIAVAEGADKGDLRARWREQLATKAREIGIAVPPPPRMGSGWTMTVGRIELRDWMAECTDWTFRGLSRNCVTLLRCLSEQPRLTLLGPREMSDLSPQSGPKRTLIRPRSSSDVLDNPSHNWPTSHQGRGATWRNCLNKPRNSSGAPSLPSDRSRPRRALPNLSAKATSALDCALDLLDDSR
jgi:hypothetical protein